MKDKPQLKLPNIPRKTLNKVEKTLDSFRVRYRDYARAPKRVQLDLSRKDAEALKLMVWPFQAMPGPEYIVNAKRRILNKLKRQGVK